MNFIFKLTLQLLILIPGITSASITISHKGFHNLYKNHFASCSNREFINIGAPPENTIENIKQAFEYGADYVEFDIRVTKDKSAIIFHDEYLLCNSTIKISNHTLKEINLILKKNRAKFIKEKKQNINIIPPRLITLKDVLNELPDGKFLLNPKSKTKAEAIAIKNALKLWPKPKYKNIKLWGRKYTYDLIEDNNAKLGGFIQNHWQSEVCLNDYRFSLGLFLPKSCYNQNITLEPKRDFLIWGGLKQLSEMAERHNSHLYFFLPHINNLNYFHKIINSPIKGIIVSDIQYFNKLSKQMRK